MAKKSTKVKKHTASAQKRTPWQVLKSKPAILTLVGILILAAAGVLFFPRTYEETIKKDFNYKVVYKDEASIELGIETIANDGKNGEDFITYKVTQPLFDRFFRKKHEAKKEIVRTSTNAPTTKVVLKGTRKWQYMMCSDGSYRYYTNEQFKNKNTGFTSKSPDSCAENKQGKKIGLADSSSGASRTNRPTNVPPNCTVVDIPYKTIYQQVNWLYVGQTKEGYGYNGYKFSCSDGTTKSTYNATDKIIYIGSKVGQESSATTTTPNEPTLDYAAKAKCDSDYSYAKAQISASGASQSGPSAMNTLNSLHTQCLAKAGF